MSRYRFVDPQSVRLSLSDGDWIEIKRELNAGEQRKVFAQQVKDYHADTGRPMLDPEQVGRSRVGGYLLAWSFTDRSGKPIPITDGAIDNLDQPTYREIVKAIDDHEAAIDREYEKNRTGGESKSVATLPSVA